jgi:hypothetical protein
VDVGEDHHQRKFGCYAPLRARSPGLGGRTLCRNGTIVKHVICEVGPTDSVSVMHRLFYGLLAAQTVEAAVNPVRLIATQDTP